ncbi:hypothetical protein ABT255_46735, partial [Streptomyces mirabilis]|uniref:hypothetical protein n=1 Tax=Streptomyces mirabilis TaxID=68239 RepID=UPI003325C19D
ALNVIAMVRMVHHPQTRAYADRRRTEGKTDRAGGPQALGAERDRPTPLLEAQPHTIKRQATPT